MGKQLNLNQIAPDFELMNTEDVSIRLSDFKGKKPVVLVFGRGFA